MAEPFIAGAASPSCLFNFILRAKRNGSTGFSKSPDWVQQKFDPSGIQPLVADYEELGRSQLQRDIGRTLRLTSGICARDKRQLLPQLLGRLMSQAGAVPFCAAGRQLVQRPALMTLRPSLTPPGAELVRLEGHRGYVMRIGSVARRPPRLGRRGRHRAALGRWDQRRADRFEGHGRRLYALAALPDGRLAAGADDNTVQLWDVGTGAELARLEGHRSWVRALAALPDGRLASGARDGTVRLWDARTGVELARLEGHGGRVCCAGGATGRPPRLGLGATASCGSGTPAPAPSPRQAVLNSIVC